MGYLSTDNDYYWLHLKDEEHFLLLPSKILEKNGKIIGSLQYSSKYDDYKFNYLNIDMERFRNNYTDLLS